jgi:hypothetical protein
VTWYDPRWDQGSTNQQAHIDDFKRRSASSYGTTYGGDYEPDPELRTIEEWL